MRLLQKLFNTNQETLLFSLFLLLLPTQLGKHFWPDFSLINGIRVDYLSPTVYVTDVLISLIFVIWLVRQVMSGRKNSNIEYRNSKQNRNTNDKKVKRFGHLNFETLHVFRISDFGFRIYLGVVIFLFITILLSGHIPGGLYSLMKFLEFSFIAYYVATHVSKTMWLQKVTGLLAVGIIGESVLAIAQYFYQGSVGGALYFLGERSFTASTPGIANASLNGELVMRAYGTFPHPNVLAGYLLVTMLLVFFYLFPAKNKSLQFLAITALLVGTIALLLTLSRIAIALWVLFIVAVFILQVLRKQLFKGRVVRVVIFILAIAIVWALFSQILTPRFFASSLGEEAFVQRQFLTEGAFSMIAASPLVGVGLGNFLSVLGTMQSPLSLALYLQPVHNIFLLAAAETGIIGLSLFVWFLGKTYLHLLRRKHLVNQLPLLLCLCVIMITGMADHYWLTLQQGQLLMALIIGLCWQRST